MIYEFRVYKLHPGKLDVFKKRFSKISLPLFEKHGVQYCGFWEIAKFPESSVPQVSKGGIVKKAEGSKFGQDEIAYLVAFESVEQRDKAWLDFVKDLEWQRLKAESEAQGPIVKDEISYLLKPSEFSLMK